MYRKHYRDQKAHIGHGVPYFDLYNPEYMYNRKIYLDDDVLYYSEYQKDKFAMYLSDFTSLDTCLSFFEDVYRGYEMDGEKIIIEDKGTVADYSEDDFVSDFYPGAITEQMVSKYSDSIDSYIEKKVLKENKEYNGGQAYFTFTTEKDFSGDIKDIKITVWKEFYYDSDPMKPDWIKATGTFKKITKIEYPGKDFDAESVSDMIDGFFDACNGMESPYRKINTAFRFMYLAHNDEVEYLYES